MQKRSIEELLDFSLCLIDKPPGPSSHEVSAMARKILGAKKTGHSGTLDPQVSGLLLVGVGRATRFLHYLSRLQKEYVCIMKFHKRVSAEQIHRIFREFSGEITQTPPKESAVRKVARKRKVYYLAPAQISNHTVLFSVLCEAGTYIRTLCRDMGARCGGAHMCELRRTSVGKLTADNAHTLQGLSDAVWAWKERKDEGPLRKILTPPEEFLFGFKKIHIKETAVENILSGAPLHAPGLHAADAGIAKDEFVALMDAKGSLVAMAKAACTSEQMGKTKGVIAFPKLVAMTKSGVRPQGQAPLGVAMKKGGVES